MQSTLTAHLGALQGPGITSSKPPQCAAMGVLECGSELAICGGLLQPSRPPLAVGLSISSLVSSLVSCQPPSNMNRQQFVITTQQQPHRYVWCTPAFPALPASPSHLGHLLPLFGSCKLKDSCRTCSVHHLLKHNNNQSMSRELMSPPVGRSPQAPATNRQQLHPTRECWRLQ